MSDGRLTSNSQNGQMRDLDAQGGKVLGDEWAEHVVLNRSGIMLRASTLLVGLSISSSSPVLTAEIRPLAQ
jgi:hypothetical protein